MRGQGVQRIPLLLNTQLARLFILLLCLLSQYLHVLTSARRIFRSTERGI